MNSHSDMGSLEAFKLPDWLQRIFFNGVFLGRRFDQKTVAVFGLIQGHQVLNCKWSGYSDNRKPIFTQFKSQFFLRSCPCCFQAFPVFPIPFPTPPPPQFLAEAEVEKMHVEQKSIKNKLLGWFSQQATEWCWKAAGLRAQDQLVKALKSRGERLWPPSCGELKGGTVRPPT